ncbi:MAG: hypothetical protein ACYCSQ_00885 [bacterium]
MFYILLGSDKPKAYVKKCSNRWFEIYIKTETDFIREEYFCELCLYRRICKVKEHIDVG